MTRYTIEDEQGNCYRLIKQGNAGSDSRDPCNWYLGGGKFSLDYLLDVKEAVDTYEYMENVGGTPLIREHKSSLISSTVLRQDRAKKEYSKENIERYVESLSHKEYQILLELIISKL